jgi:hypothetical protein
MAPTMIGPQTAVAEIAKIVAMRAHDHQSLSADCPAVATLAFLRASTRGTFATAILLGMICGKKWACRRSMCIPEIWDFSVCQTGGIETGICLRHLKVDGELNTRQLAERVMCERKLEVSDTSLRNSVVFKGCSVSAPCRAAQACLWSRSVRVSASGLLA